MQMIKKLKNILLGTLRKPGMSVAEQKKLIDSMPEPRDDFDRTYFTYKCNVHNSAAIKKVGMDIVFCIAIPAFLIIYAFNRLFRCRKEEPADAIIITAANRTGQQYNYAGRVPGEVYEKYEKVKELKLDSYPSFTKGMVGNGLFKTWLKFFIRHPFRGYINFRCLLNLASLNRLLLMYSPKAVFIGRAEANSISSVQTYFCEQLGIEYNNFMHGDLRLTMLQSFVRFTHFYVWDEHYVDILEWGRCPHEQFIVYLPDIYNVKPDPSITPEYSFTYYLSGDLTARKDLYAEDICKILEGFQKRGMKCKVRPHPRWSDRDDLERIFGGTDIEIEWPETRSTKESVLLSEKIIGTFSTVIAEAFYMGKPVVIDDITDKKLFEELQENHYIMLYKEHELLSDLVRKYEG